MFSNLHRASPPRSRGTLQARGRRWLSAFALLGAGVVGCETSDATYAVVSNDFEGAAPPVVYEVWWSVALFREPVLPGQSSNPVRIVRGSDHAYALLAPSWDASSGTAPSHLIAVRSTEPLTASRGQVLPIALSDATTTGDCAAGSMLSAEDASFITERIFPGEFAGTTYDPLTCTSTPHASTGDSGSE